MSLETLKCRFYLGLDNRPSPYLIRLNNTLNNNDWMIHRTLNET